MKNFIHKQFLAFIICFSSTNFSIAQCVASFTFTQGINGAVTFSDTSTGTSTNTTYYWEFDDPLSMYNYTTTQNPTHIYGSNGVYTVTLSINSNTIFGPPCSSSVVVTITVTSSACNMPIDANWSSTVSVGTASFTSLCTGTTGLATYSWNFGDGNSSVTTNPIHTYTSNGWFNVKLKVTDGGCVDSLEGNWVVVCLIQTSFTSAAGLNGAYNFTSTSTNTAGVTSFVWNYGDGNFGFGASSTHTYNTNGTYTVTLDVTPNFSCQTTSTAVIVVSNATCNISVGFNQTVLPGGVVNFSSTSTGTIGGAIYEWNYGDGTTGLGLTSSHTYSNGGSHNVQLKVTNNVTCSDSLISSVNVNSIPCLPISNFSLAFSGTPLFWIATPSYPWNVTCAEWNWGDGTTSYSCAIYTSHTYSVAGFYTVCLTVTTSCGTSSTCAGYNIFKSQIPVEVLPMITINVVPQSQFVTNLNMQSMEDAVVNIYPNPSDGKIYISMNNINYNTQIVNVEVLNLLSKTVYSDKINVQNGSFETTFNLDYLSPGAYFIKIKTGQRTYLLKSIINK